MSSVSPIVDCGIHYVDVMCQMCRANAVRVSGLGVRLSDELPPDKFNYSHLQITFDDGSVGWYEAGWGPMMSEVAFFIKDVIGPRGSASIVAPKASAEGQSANVNAHTQTQIIRRHFSELDRQQHFARADEQIAIDDEPDHDALCQREQEYFLKTIREDIDLAGQYQHILNSMRIVAAADESSRTGKTVEI